LSKSRTPAAEGSAGCATKKRPHHGPLCQPGYSSSRPPVNQAVAVCSAAACSQASHSCHCAFPAVPQPGSCQSLSCSRSCRGGRLAGCSTRGCHQQGCALGSSCQRCQDPGRAWLHAVAPGSRAALADLPRGSRWLAKLERPRRAEGSRRLQSAPKASRWAAAESRSKPRSPMALEYPAIIQLPDRPDGARYRAGVVHAF
jgi:hypothetical protein